MSDSIAFSDLNEYNERLIKYVHTYFFRLSQVEATATPSMEQFPADEGFFYIANLLDQVFAEKEKDSKKEGLSLPLHHLRRQFSLDFFSFFCLLLAYCCAIDEETMQKAKQHMGKINADVPTISLAVSLVRTRFHMPYNSTAMNDSLHLLFQYFFLPPAEGLSIHAPLTLRAEILEYLVSGKSRHQNAVFLPQDAVSLSYEMPLSLPEAIFPREHNVLLKIAGEAGIGRKTLAKLYSQKTGRPLFFISLAEQIAQPDTFFETITVLAAEARLWNAVVVITELETAASFKYFPYYLNALLDAVYDCNRHVILTVTPELELELDSIRAEQHSISIPPQSHPQQLAMWETLFAQHRLHADADLKERMAFKFQLTPLQAAASVREYQTMYAGDTLDEPRLNRCCYNSIHTDLKKYADFIPPGFSWEQLILPQTIKDSLLNACSHIVHAADVYDTWGFGKRVTYGRGVHMLFTGPPGTGKTMAAQVISSMLGMDLYKVDTSKLVSKYIGETEKNFELVFQAASKSSVILFFDEMDSLFGKRSEVSESNDKYANATTSYLLQKIEEYHGVILMATNYLNNIDEAFMRRISYVMHFPMPTAAYRKELWASMLHTTSALKKDIDLDFLAERFEIAGGVIKNIVLSAAFLAAAEKSSIGMKHIVQSLYYDLSKQGKTIIRSEFTPYDFYLDSL